MSTAHCGSALITAAVPHREGCICEGCDNPGCRHGGCQGRKPTAGKAGSASIVTARPALSRPLVKAYLTSEATPVPEPATA